MPRTRLTANQQLIFDFFRLFSRFEYALKAEGVIRKSDEAVANAEPDWDVLARAIQTEQWMQLRREQEFREACDYILEQPPMKQVVRDNELGWAAAGRGPKQSEAVFVMLCVRRIRNNLFHGGKAMKMPPERDKRLISYGIAILRGVLRIREDLQRHFEEGAP